MSTITRFHQRAAGALILGVVLAVTGCTDTGAEDGETTQAASTTAGSTASDGGSSPQQRVEGYIRAVDAAAAEGWKDTSYNAEYLTPELAEKAETDDARNRDTGATVQGERVLSHWTTTEESETSTVLEFCQDLSGMSATKDGQPYELNQTGQRVSAFKLTRATPEDEWLIAEMGQYEEGVTCADHFGG